MNAVSHLFASSDVRLAYCLALCPCVPGGGNRGYERACVAYVQVRENDINQEDELGEDVGEEWGDECWEEDEDGD